MKEFTQSCRIYISKLLQGGAYVMRNYTLTVFNRSGEKLLDETYTAASDDEAKEIGTAKLEEGGYLEYTHRCVTPEAKLILFHR